MGNHPSSHHQHHQQQQQQQHPSSRSHSSISISTNNNNQSNNNNNSNTSNLNPFHHQSQQQQPQGPPLPPLSTTFVDGGYLLPLSNIYPASQQDWLQDFVQRLILSKKLAPFYRGLEDWDESWDTDQILKALKLANQSRQKLIHEIQKKESKEKSEQEKLTNSGTTSRRLGKTLEGQLSSNQSSSIDSNPQSRKDVFEAVLNWDLRPEEAICYLKQTAECPICFLYYPSNINLSRCCQQPICTECFVQIKRADPTAQELKSEPACCPYCVESNFGVTYEAPKPPNTASISKSDDPLSTESSSSPTHPELSSSSPPTTPILTPEPHDTSIPAQSSKRRQNTSHTSQDVVTTDSIQPDWQLKLEAVKATVARRANRRIVFRQEGDRLIPVGITSSRDPSGSFLTGIEHESGAGTGTGSTSGTISSRRTLASFSNLVGGHGSESTSSRRSRNEPSFGVDLEELMIMEAMRLSLVEEEDRKKKAEEEEAKLQRISQAISEACGEEEDPKKHHESMKIPVPVVNRSPSPTPSPSTSQLPIPISEGSGPFNPTGTSPKLANDEHSLGLDLSSTPPRTQSRADTPTPQAFDSPPGPTIPEPSTPRTSYLFPTLSSEVETKPNLTSAEEPRGTEVSKPWGLERSVSTSSSFLVSDDDHQVKLQQDGGIYEDLGEYEPLVNKVSEEPLPSASASGNGNGNGNRNENDLD